MTCTKTGECPTCETPQDKLDEFVEGQNLGHQDLEQILEALDSFDNDPGAFLQVCSEAGIKPIVEPFWKDLPYVHIYRSITPDILHQLYQGIIKHLISWVTKALGPLEVDARGITSLSRVTGQEHNQMSHILMGLVLNAPLLDSLRRFHDNKSIFVDLDICDVFNIPKLHSTRHYIKYIKLYSTLDNFNTEYMEHLHIDLVKDAYAATNHKDKFTQMTIWLEWKEKILRHRQYVE
ncbi:hypothetical protein BYT27DRAFT_7301505 [Phlegmacium glaucopus]|nr:hypothetical protein BYT27DRAFT_7301505 [Phlegmacium glaucopus]